MNLPTRKTAVICSIASVLIAVIVFLTIELQPAGDTVFQILLLF